MSEIAQLHAIAEYLRGLDNNEDADYLLSLAASLEAQEPVAWLVERERDGTFPRLLHRKDDARRLVESITVHPKASMHPLYIQPPTSVVPVPDPDWKYDTALIFAAAHHLDRVMEEHPYCDHVQVVKHYADIRRKQKAAAAPQQGGGDDE